MPKKVLRSPLLKVPTTTSKVIKEVRTPWIITIERPKKVLRSPLLKVPTTNIKDITYWYCTYQNISTSVLFSLSKPSALTLSCRWLINRPPYFQISKRCKNIYKDPKDFIFSPDNQGGSWRLNDTNLNSKPLFKFSECKY